MHRGIAEISSHGITAMSRLNPREILSHQVERFVPSDPLPTLRCPPHGVLKPVFIEMDVL
jgi:hypothetical protein